MKFWMSLLAIMCATRLFGDGLQLIKEAAKEEKYLIMFLYDVYDEKTAQQLKVFDNGVKKTGTAAQSAKIDISNLAERGVVQRFSLNTLPMPFVVVLAPNGIITGAFATFTEEKLAAAIFSHAKAACLKASQERKLLLLCIQNKETFLNKESLLGITEFKEDPRFSAEIVMVDPADVKEKDFLEKLGVNIHAKEAQIAFLTPINKIIGLYSGAIKKDQLVHDLQKPSSCYCGPEGRCQSCLNLEKE